MVRFGAPDRYKSWKKLGDHLYGRISMACSKRAKLLQIDLGSRVLSLSLRSLKDLGLCQNSVDFDAELRIAVVLVVI